MSRDLEKLDSDFKTKVTGLLNACAVRGVTMRPFYTERSPWMQARIWRSTRSTNEVLAATERLKANRAPYLASVVLGVGPQYSPPSARGHLTNALPGVSWHQWGEAIDCFWLVQGRAEWSVKTIQPLTNNIEGNGYQVYADEALELGLLSAGLAWGWDWPHVQLRNSSSPLSLYSWEQIDRAMLRKFGETEVS